MSFLFPPRVTFFGTVWANASTGTNNDLADVFDVDTLEINPLMSVIPGAQVTYPAPGENHFNWRGPQDNPALRQWLMGLMVTPPGIHEGGYGQQAHWNYYGDHNTEFRSTAVTNVTPAGPTADPLVGAQVELLGDVFYQTRRGAVLVDVDPYALVTSQVFSGQFLVSATVDGKKVPLLEANQPTRAWSYYINPYKNLNPDCIGFEPVSAIFICAVPNSQLVFNNAVNSPALAALQKAAAAGQGLQIRYCFYDAVFQIAAPDLYKDFAAKNYVANPYIGCVLGTIGVWGAGELASAPPGRKLTVQTPYTYTPPSGALTADERAARKQSMATLAQYKSRNAAAAPASPPPPTRAATLGATLAEVDAQNFVVRLDAISTFPEADPATREKFDLGPMELRLLYGNGQSVTVGPVPNDKATYEAGGGVLDISYANNPQRDLIAAQIAAGTLGIYQVNTGTMLIQERAGIDVQTDDRSVYFDAKVGQGPAAVPGTSAVTIQVFDRGAAPTTATPLNLEYWMCAKDFVNPDKPQVNVVDRYFTVAGAAPLPPTTYPNPLYNPADPDSPKTIPVLTDRVVVPPGGRLALSLTALRAGVSMIRFADPTSPQVTPNFAWDNVDFAIVRILPFDDYSGYTDDQINSWPFIYQHFFSYFSVMYPIMSKVIPWGPDDAPNNPDEVKDFASEILMFTSDAMWNSTIYMPITRDMSGGKRALLHRWCNLQQ